MVSPHILISNLLHGEKLNIIIKEKEITPIERAEETNIIRMAYEREVKILRIFDNTIFRLSDLDLQIEKFPHLFGRYKRKLDGKQPRAIFDDLKEGELKLPDVQWILNYQSSEPDRLIEYVPKIEDFWYSIEELQYLENFKQNENRSKYSLIPGETYALNRMNEVLSNLNDFETYLENRNILFETEIRKINLYPWITTGWLSPCRVYHEILKLEIQNENIKLHAFYYKIDLLWKDFLKYWAMK